MKTKKNAFAYMLLTRFKNGCLEMVRHPGRLVYILFLLAMVAVSVFSGNKSAGAYGEPRDIRELCAMTTALYAVVFVAVANAGFGDGASMFRLPDVNMVFTAPLSPVRVLFFGLLQQLGTSLVLGVFLVFQYSWLHGLYRITFGQLLLIMLGYAAVIFCGQLTALFLYASTSADDAKRRRWRIVFYAVVGFFAALLVVDTMLHRADFLARAAYLLTTPLFQLFPVAGWVAAAVGGAFTGTGILFWLGIALTVLYIAGVVYTVAVTDVDYYEDVLKTAELSYSAVTAKKQGQSGESVPRSIRVGKIGLGRGWGAGAFYRKHQIENRRSRLLLVDRLSLIFCGVSVLFGYFLREDGLTAAFLFSVYLQLFTVSLGRINKELTKPYVYMVPEAAFLKLWNCLRESFPGFLTESVLIFLPLKFILGCGWIDILCAILGRFAFSLLFTAGNLAVQRFFGSAGSRAVTFLFYFLCILAMAAPGAALAIVLTVRGTVLLSPGATIPLATSLCNLPVAALAFFLCRNMLEYAELNYN